MLPTMAYNTLHDLHTSPPYMSSFFTCYSLLHLLYFHYYISLLFFKYTKHSPILGSSQKLTPLFKPLVINYLYGSPTYISQVKCHFLNETYFDSP